jgi:hypothetical protein
VRRTLPTETQSDLIGKGVHRRFGISGVELGDDRHTLPPLLFLVLPPVLGPLACCFLAIWINPPDRRRRFAHKKSRWQS